MEQTILKPFVAVNWTRGLQHLQVDPKLVAEAQTRLGQDRQQNIPLFAWFPTQIKDLRWLILVCNDYLHLFANHYF